MEPEYTNLVELFEQACNKFGASELFGTKKNGRWEWLTFGQFKAEVDKCRGGLVGLGVGAGDAVAIIANNRVEWAVFAYATYSLGAIYVPMYEVQPKDEWEFILKDSAAKVVVAATGEIATALEAMQARCPSLLHVINLAGGANAPNSYPALLAKGAESPTAAVFPNSLATAGLIYTSGTTGMPKGVILTHQNICFDIHAAFSRFDFGPSDRSLAFLPWAHSFGQVAELHGLISRGTALAINDEIPNLVANLPEVRPTVLVAVPRIFNRIYDGIQKQMAAKPKLIQALFRKGIEVAGRIRHGESVSWIDKLSHALADKLIFSKVRAKFGGRLRFAVSGSSALNPDVAKFIDALGIEVYEGYGLSETSPVATSNYPGHRKIGSVGLPLPGVEIKIDKSVHDDNRQGEILIKGKNVMQGYHNRPEETALALPGDGYLHTGDLGYLDSDGYLFITGRIKEQYKLENGKYVAPAPLEEELKLSPYIANAMLHGANRPFNVALIVVDTPSLSAWAKEAGIELGVLAKNAQVHALLMREIETYGAKFKSYEKPKKLHVVDEDFLTENELLTPSLKIKRRNVFTKYGKDLEALYT